MAESTPAGDFTAQHGPEIGFNAAHYYHNRLSELSSHLDYRQAECAMVQSEMEILKNDRIYFLEHQFQRATEANGQLIQQMEDLRKEVFNRDQKIRILQADLRRAKGKRCQEKLRARIRGQNEILMALTDGTLSPKEQRAKMSALYAIITARPRGTGENATGEPKKVDIDDHLNK